MKTPPPRRKVSLPVIVYFGAVALVAFGLLAFVLTRGTGEIRRCGRVFRIPVPYASLQIGSSENRATYLTLGYPDLQGIFSSRGGAFGWEFGGQYGATYAMPSTQDERLMLSALVELRTTYFTRTEFLVVECGSRTCVSPANCPKDF
ncbi:MAG: hypothetical protein ABI134_22765 [Byssovorax sp.]